MIKNATIDLPAEAPVCNIHRESQPQRSENWKKCKSTTEVINKFSSRSKRLSAWLPDFTDIFSLVFFFTSWWILNDLFSFSISYVDCSMWVCVLREINAAFRLQFERLLAFELSKAIYNKKSLWFYDSIAIMCLLSQLHNCLPQTFTRFHAI